MANYATVNDVIALWRSLSDSEQAMAQELLTTVSAEIRESALKTGRDFDVMITRDEDLAVIAKSVCVDVVKRYICSIADESPAMSQMTQSAGGYSVSGTFLTPGGGFLLKRSELARLGLRRQRIGCVEQCN